MRKLKKSVFAFMLLASASHAFADAPIPCPSPASVSQSWQLIDTVSVLSPARFGVWGMQSLKDNTGRDWTVVTYSTANDMDTAFAAGQNNVKNITDSKRENALDVGDAYLCGYDTPKESLGVALVSYKDGEQTISFGKVDFKMLNGK